METQERFRQELGNLAESARFPHSHKPIISLLLKEKKRRTETQTAQLNRPLNRIRPIPFFQRLGFHRVSPAGHKDKTNEFGKDLWMKLQLPTGHWLYFCAQIKREKLDSSGAGGDKNVATVLSQVRMAINHPIFDSDTNRKVLLDHIFIISAGEITKQARAWLVEKLDTEQRRHIIFMDRSEFLDHAARILLDLKLEEAGAALKDEDIPF